MSMSINTVLSQAYGLIEADKLDEAVDLLKPVLAEHPNNADAWWLYAHAVTDVDDARAALQTVLQIDPQYPEAERLLEMLEEATRGQFITNPLTDMQLQPIRAIPDLPEDMPEVEPMTPAEREMAYLGTERRPQRGIPWGRVGLLALLFIAAIVAALLLSQSALAPGGEPTQVAADRTAGQETAAAAMTFNAALQTDVVDGTADTLSLTATALIEQVTLSAPTVDPTQESALETSVAVATQFIQDATASAEAGASGTPEASGEDFNLTGTAIIDGATGTAARAQTNAATESALIQATGTAEMGMRAETATSVIAAASQTAAIAFTQTAESAQAASATEDASLNEIRQTATAIIAGATETAEARAAAQVTASPTPVVGDAQAVALEPVQVAFAASFGEEAAVSVETTAAGDTLVIRLCSQAPGILLRATLDQAVQTLQGQAALLRFGIDGVGYRLVNCSDDTEYRLLTSSLEDALAYADGRLEIDAYQARLRAR